MAKLIIALDLPSAADALRLAARLMGCTRWFKVGLQLFISSGPRLISELRELGAHIFLDLKFYDIPNTCAAATKAACSAGADMLTIHCQGGRNMAEAVINAAAQSTHRPLIMGVTALTSFGPGEMPGINEEPGVFGRALARMAQEWNLDGVICSALEVPFIKGQSPDLLCVCPGIRPDWAAANDQQRIVTPARALALGADYLVVGRPVTQAPDAVEAAQSILQAMLLQQ